MLFNSLILDSVIYTKNNLNIVFRKNITTTIVRYKRILNYPKLIVNEVIKNPKKELSHEDEVLNLLKDKLIYNSIVSKKNTYTRWKVRQVEFLEKEKLKKEQSVPLSLKYMYDSSELGFDEYENFFKSKQDIENENSDKDSSTEAVHLPYSVVKKIDIQLDTTVPFSSAKSSAESSAESSDSMDIDFREKINVKMHKIGKKWMSDYEVFEEDYIDDDKIEIPDIDYGTADSNILPSNVPCGGCGAHLHCQSYSIPGYLPKEIFLKCSDKDLHFVVCQRCTFLKQYNIALSVNVDQDSYPKLISSLKDKKILIILLVDMTDFPCSIWPEMLEILGKDKPIVLVGNKIDLIPGDSPGWLENAKQILRKLFPSDANILHTALISAKNGFGIEELITKVQTVWSTKGDVYLIGCTNVGKSSLFNDLLQSDFCKSKAVDLIQRATIAPWPGTTLNLLKFPILRLSSWRAFLRSSRLVHENQLKIEERKIEQIQARENKTKFSRLPKIIGQIGMTFNQRDTKNMNADQNDFAMPFISKTFLKEDNKKTLDPNDPAFRESKWCYDTPGVVHRDQIINILTTDEIVNTLPEKIINPRIFSLYVEQTLFIGGLARLDLLSSEYKFIRVIVYSSDKLPVTLCETKYADDVYNTLLGTSFMAVPSGNAARLKQWPTLKSVKDFELIGAGNSHSISDIVLSNAGWVSFTSPYKYKFIIRPFTPEGRGIYLRNMPLLKYTPQFRRKRVANTPTYFMSHA